MRLPAARLKSPREVGGAGWRGGIDACAMFILWRRGERRGGR
jgi:hypothetical protein